MSSQYKVITPVSTEPITLSDAKSYLRVDFTDDDTLIGEIISRSRSLAETWTGRAFATQQIQQIDTIERPTGGELSGSIEPGPNWYQYQEQLGANPFGAAQFYFDLASPPVQGDETTVTVETRVTAFDPWVTSAIVLQANGAYNRYLDTISEPARLYFQVPVTANFWRFTYMAGYNTSYPVPPDLLQPMFELVSYFYQFREGGSNPEQYKEIQGKLLAKRIDWI